MELKVVNLMEEEQTSPEYLQMNPQHTVPMIDDDGFYLWESRAILCYLMESSAPHLLPASPKERAVLNQRLYSEMGGVGRQYAAIYVSLSTVEGFMTIAKIVFPFQEPLFNGSTEMDEEEIKKLYEIFSIIEEHYFPNSNEWIAGRNVTVADFAYVTTISGLTVSTSRAISLSESNVLLIETGNWSIP